MSTRAGASTTVRVQSERDLSVTRPRRWPDATPPPVPRRTLEAVAAEIQASRRTLAERFAKRAIDVIGSVAGLVIFSPVIIGVAVAIRLTSKGPAVFVQDRLGSCARRFRFYKFRTMVLDAEGLRPELEHLNEVTGPAFKIERDPRITPLGRFLRKYSIDELPQLWNVLKGDMSLVGPRPPLPEEVERYDMVQAQRLSVMPGLTGLWQVSGRSDLPDFDHWIELDLEYVHSWSIWLDFRIMAKTIGVVILARGAQ